MKLTKPRLITACAAAAALAAVPAVATSAPGPGAGTAATKTVKVKDNYFSPKRLTVSRGTIVKFVWRGSGVHNVAVGRKIVISNRRRGSGSRRIAGSVTYNCTLHRGMRVSVRVR